MQAYLHSNLPNLSCISLEILSKLTHPLDVYTLSKFGAACRFPGKPVSNASGEQYTSPSKRIKRKHLLRR